MQIGSYTPRYSMPLEYRNQISGTAKASGSDKAPAGEDFSSHFSGPDDVKMGRDGYGGVYYQTTSASGRLSAQWDRWRAQLDEDPDANLPNSTGWTEENIAYLKERYSSDELTWVEREDALETMKKLGMISSNQASMAEGGGLHRVEITGKVTRLANGVVVVENQPVEDWMKAPGFDINNPFERDWNVLFKGKPIVGFLTIDDILNWAKDLPDETWDPMRLRIQEAVQ